ncbi:MAG: lysophospholipid transporter LplT, partial [Zoogloeaceae bacterium]|nr:lysophospholipid transporter LplT [Zoogloeaceae bacterium]
GVVLGGIIIRPDVADSLLAFELPFIDTVAQMNVLIIGALYLIAALFNLYIPDTGVDHKPLSKNPLYLVREFNHCLRLLWRDRLGQISLAVTTLFWGAGATLQFIVIEWASTALDLDLSDASMLQGFVAIGVAIGAILAAKMISLRKSVQVIPLGLIMGIGMILMIFIREMWQAVPLLIIVGALSGFFVVPMNALLQHRGHILMGAGHSIAVQNFNENLSILIMTGVYALLIAANLSIYFVIALFGIFVSAMMWLVRKRHFVNQQEHDDVALLDG